MQEADCAKFTADAAAELLEIAYWESTFTEVIDTNSRAIFVRMFENEDMLYLLDFNGTHKLNSIAEWID